MRKLEEMYQECSDAIKHTKERGILMRSERLRISHEEGEIVASHRMHVREGGESHIFPGIIRPAEELQHSQDKIMQGQGVAVFPLRCGLHAQRLQR